ncbi:prolipoprotein diacylglyceryl transferase [Candidatus Woesebacteria bacterium]|nr:prolipoprotein diacylglyceryl transferase [Candidatus Woesebacteria bacterium]MCD8507356.1 prolipoprotein diacylglyceryl transferase [Candidatus Woesebacteria bacterium]MCD8546789.1 prolipoprotein diacylglyceryl transferase [Candidatus Woesebacteria bacterium]
MFGISASLAQALGWGRVLLGWSAVLIAIIGGLYFFWRKAREEHFELMEAFDGIVWSAILGIFSARIGYIVLHFDQFGWRVLRWMALDGYPGLWGILGLAVAFGVLYRWAKQQKQDLWEVWDFYSILLAWYMGWYWLSRFFFGAAAGRPTSLPWGIVFPQRVEPAHPVQIYAAVVYIALFAYLWWVEPKYRFFLWYRSKKRTAKTGYLFSFFVIVSGLLGFGLSFVQYPFWLVWDVDINQLLSVLLFFVGGVLLYIRSGRTFFMTKSKERGGPNESLK